jgi:phosphate transport system substrate-binding protein
MFKLFTTFIGMTFLMLSSITCFAEEIKIGAGAAPTENIFKKIQEPMEKAIGVKLILISNGPSDALKDLDKGAVDAASGGGGLSGLDGDDG